MVDPRLTNEAPEALAGAAEYLLAHRGNDSEIIGSLNRSTVPALTVDSERRYVDVNRPARLLFRRSLGELRGLRVDDFTPADVQPMLEATWRTLLEQGSVGGEYDMGFPDGSRLVLAFWALAEAL